MLPGHSRLSYTRQLDFACLDEVCLPCSALGCEMPTHDTANDSLGTPVQRSTHYPHTIHRMLEFSHTSGLLMLVLLLPAATGKCQCNNCYFTVSCAAALVLKAESLCWQDSWSPAAV